MPNELAKREVSCLGLTFFYDYLESHGIPRAELQKDLPYSPEHLNNRINWIDYQTFLEIERRMAAFFPQDPQLFYNIGRTFAATKGLGFTRIVVRAVLSPFQVYSRVPRLVKRFLFPFVTIRFERIDRQRLRAHYLFDAGFAPSESFLQTVRGILTGVPMIMGAAPAEVSLSRPAAHEATFDIKLGFQWVGPVEFFRSMGRRIGRTLSMRVRNVGEAVVELEETNRLLMDQVEALTIAESQLAGRVRELSILNVLAHATSKELELQRLLSEVATILADQMPGVRAAVLLAEGDPPGLVIAASARIPRDLELALRDLANPNSPAVALIVREKKIHRFFVNNDEIVVLPMVSHEKASGALAFGLQEVSAGGYEIAFLESMVGQIATGVVNATAYQTIADLRDRLEIRVHERTAELEEARGNLEDTVERLKRSDDARNRFFTNVSHELRTPLTLILAPLDDLEAAIKGGDSAENLRLIRHNATTLLRLVNEILDFAKLDADQMALSIEKLELNQFVDDVVIALRPLANRKRIEMTYQREGATPIDADPKLLRRVLVNLITNAIKYSDEGDTVRVDLIGRFAEIDIVVSDTGPGIPEEYRSKIFERFQRVPDAKGRIIEGSGIGLAMVKEIVTLHGGRIRVDSEVGKGSSFHVTLPRLIKSSEARATPLIDPVQDHTGELFDFEAVAPHTPVTFSVDLPATQSTARGRVLLVEDNIEMRDFMLRLFVRNYSVLTAPDGNVGLETAKRELPDVIVSDVMMPGMDGYEMCRALKADPITRNVPVVLVSARHGSEAALQGFNAGADDFVCKPFSAPELLARVDAQIRIRTLGLAMIRLEKQTTVSLLSAGLAHEVMNPLNAVINAVTPLRRELEKLEAGAEAEMAPLLLETIQKAANRIRQVVDGVLRFARQDLSGPPRLKPARISECIDAVLAILTFRVTDQVVVHREILWDEAFACMPELLNQLLMNLFVNAFDAIGKSGNVWVRTERVGGEALITVCDDGPGIPREKRERVFDPFFTTKPPGSGTGLGLSICREIAELHGGTIEVGAENRHGAELIVRLPIPDLDRIRFAPEIRPEP